MKKQFDVRSSIIVLRVEIRSIFLSVSMLLYWKSGRRGGGGVSIVKLKGSMLVFL